MRFTRALLLVLAACDINEGGELDVLVDGGPNDVVVVDVAPKDVVEEPFVCADAGVASCADAVAFRSPALYSGDAGAPCPPGYDTHDLVFATPTSATCTCNCTDNGAAACDTTKVSYNSGAGGVCTVGGGYSLAGSCTQTTQTTIAGEYLEIDPPAVTGGCGGGVSVPPPSTTSNVRLCTPQCTSDESVCTGTTGLRACVSVAGNVASCPPSYPAGPFYIGSGAQPTCDNCSCVETGDCTASTVHDYSDTVCGAGDQGFPMDGVCHQLTGGHVGTFDSSKIMPMIKTAACNVTSGASHMTYSVDDFSVCCK